MVSLYTDENSDGCVMTDEWALRSHKKVFSAFPPMIHGSPNGILAWDGAQFPSRKGMPSGDWPESCIRVRPASLFRGSKVEKISMMNQTVA